MNSNIFIIDWPKKWFIATAMKKYGHKVIPPTPKGIGLAASISIQTEREMKALQDRDHAYFITWTTAMELYMILLDQQHWNIGNKRYEAFKFFHSGGIEYRGTFHTNIGCSSIQISEVRRIVEELMQA